jgi:transcription-repair coupling factor (superfamily II helicase)
VRDGTQEIPRPAASPLVGRVARSERATLVRAALESAGGGRVHVSGLRGTSFVLLAEALRDRLSRPLLVVCPDDEAAADTHSDFRTLSSGRALLLPERDIFPHRFETRENPTVRGDRNDCLTRIAAGEVDVVVTSLLGFLEKTLRPQTLRAHRRVVGAGEHLDLEELREYLVVAGYDAVPVVEETGQFAVRGAIVDVFDPSWDNPARIELFDDEVASIRSFDIDTQRSIASLESMAILPATSVPFEEEAVAGAADYLHSRGFDGDLVARIEEEVRTHRASYLWRRYAPALGLTGELLEFFPRPPVVVFSDVASVNRMHRRLRENIARAASHPEDEFPLLAPDDYLHAPDCFDGRAWATLWHWDLAAHAEAAPEEGEDAGPYPPPTPREAHTRFLTGSHPSVAGSLEPLVEQLRKYATKRLDVHVYAETATQRERLADMLDEAEELVHMPVGWITSGFVWEEMGLALLTDHQIFGRMLARPHRREQRRRVQGIRHEHLQLGDVVVHVDYGIGRFVGLEVLSDNGKDTECLKLRYAAGDTIYVPLEQMHLVEKYVAKEGAAPQLDRLGSARWQRTKESARKAIEDVARELLSVYAEREVAAGHAFTADGPWQRELEASFPYEETPHQLRASEEIRRDMELPRPMDRLVCGDVGYGKTEVAIRAAFKAASQGKQVAVLVPTTLLAYQHFTTFQERMGRFPLRMAMLSRFIPPAEQAHVVQGLRDGTVDIVVGTHRLLSKDISFKAIGLLIVDEEHRFGVKHKERLKQLSKTVDVLALTATPIPRTLYMSLSGLRRISIIDTPPRNRHPVKTEVTPFDEDTIQRAIADEVAREGQVFFVHNRVRSINSVRAFLERLNPGVRFRVAHGQMSERELEKAMLEFVKRRYDVLVSTMIIESGLDLPNVNTIIVNRADRFGLAQLYQLRGRVGRRERQAYAYLLVPRQISLTESAARRLQAMEEFEELGSGYRLAMRDLEIRGAGNVLGVQQHGHVAAVGFEMYCRMLKEEVEKVRDGRVAEPPQCRVESPYDCFIPAEYIADPDERMMIYKRLAGMTEPEDVGAMNDELADRFGPAPSAVRNLLDLTQVKLLASSMGVVSVQIREPGRRAPLPEALKRAADVPRRPAPVPPGVRRSRAGSSRLARIAQRLDAGTLANASRGTLTLEFAPDRAFLPEQCGRLVETFGTRVLFKSGRPFGVELAASTAAPLLLDTKNLLQVAYFSTRIAVSSGPDSGPR